MLDQTVHASVRPAEIADAEALAAVFAESWGSAYRCIIPHPHLQAMIRRRGDTWWASAVRNRETITVLAVGEEIGGYATFGLSRTRGAYDGEIYELYLKPTFQGLGLGELLFESCRARLDERSLKGLIVWALSANDAAATFYKRRGGRVVGRSHDRIGGARLEKTAFGWA